MMSTVERHKVILRNNDMIHVCIASHSDHLRRWMIV